MAVYAERGLFIVEGPRTALTFIVDSCYDFLAIWFLVESHWKYKTSFYFTIAMF